MSLRSWLVAPVALASALATQPSSACTLPASAFSIAEVSPAEPALAALNAPLLVSFRNEGLFMGSSEMPFLMPSLTLQVPGSDVAIPLGEGAGVAGYLGSDTTYRFVPTAPLEPNTVYEVRAQTGQGPQTQLAGPAERTWQFTTGTELRAPLSVDGVLSVSFEPGSQPTMDCRYDSTCSNSCSVVGTHAVTMARVQLPAVSGGFTAQFGHAFVMVTERVPWVETHAPAEGDAIQAFVVEAFEPAQPGEVLLPMPERVDGQAYPPCFTFKVTDERGDQIGASLCPDDVTVAPAADAGEDGTADQSSSACSFRPGAQPGQLWLPGLLLLTALSRRRRS